MSANIPRDLRPLVRSLQAQGWRVEQTVKSHFKFFPPNGGPMVLVSGTPSDNRARKNMLADLRRSCPFEE